jgi:FkbM family methyltransferase
MVLAALVRAALYPARKAVVSFPRGNPVRSACVLLVKAAAKNRKLMQGLTAIEPLDRPDLSFSPADSMVLDHVYWGGMQSYEGILAALWSELNARSRSTLEVGGNIGFYTILGGKAAKGRYTVVEPIPHIAGILRENVRRNHLGSVEVIEAAVIPARERQLVTLNLPDESREIQTGAHVVENVEISSRQSLRTLTVDGIPFAELIADRDLIKIDAEGLEFALLQSCRAELEAQKPTLVVEVLPESIKLADLVKQLAAAAGYRLFVPPAYGSDAIVEVPLERFDSRVPQSLNSKDVVLSTMDVRRFVGQAN